MMKACLILCAALALAATVAGKPKPAIGFNFVNGERQYYNDEMEWMMLTDDSGKPQIAILKGPEIDVQAADLPNDVQFHLFTKSNTNNGYRLNVGDAANLQASPFNSANPTKFVIHGFTNDVSSPAIQDVKNAYLASGAYNVIGVDWGALANGPNYDAAKRNTQVAGPYVAQMMNHLVSAGGSSFAKTHCSGHSLGAHICGIAGNSVNGKMARISGLDAALPLFADDANNIRLDPSDASFVDSIHTCAGWLGFRETVGHADFYPNGGHSVQPGCGADLTGACSHGRAYEYFSETIRNNNRYPAHKCSSVSAAEAGNCDAGTSGNMGEGASTSMRGVFYMAT